MRNTVTVRARMGRRVFFPRRVISAPGGRVLSIDGATEAEVDGDDRFIRRRLLVGDLILVEKTEKRSRKPAEESEK